MSRATFLRWTIPTTLTTVALLVFAVGAAPQPRNPAPMPDQAKEKADLVAQGQLGLAEATKIAERHVKGTALSAISTMRMDEATPPEQRPTPHGPSAADDAKPASGHLVYDVSCYVADKVQIVQVDGLTRKVIGDTPNRPPQGPEKP